MFSLGAPLTALAGITQKRIVRELIDSAPPGVALRLE